MKTDCAFCRLSDLKPVLPMCAQPFSMKNLQDKFPGPGRRLEDTDDEYIQYLNSVDRYRQNNPNPKPFRKPH